MPFRIRHMMRLVSSPEATRDELYAKWLAWVERSLGHNERLAAMAASAAADAVAQGSGFNAAVDAARSAWGEAAGGRAPATVTSRPPFFVLAAMGIAIGGAAVSSALSLWFAAINVQGTRDLAVDFAIFNLSLVALNTYFLYAMWHGASWAWRAMYVLVVAGAVLDVIGVFVPPLFYVDFGAAYLAATVWPTAGWLTAVTPVWLWVHVVFIQAPILLLLRSAPARQWFGTGAPTPAHP